MSSFLPDQRGDPVTMYNSNVIDVTPFFLDLGCKVVHVKEKAQELRHQKRHSPSTIKGRKDKTMHNTLVQIHFNQLRLNIMNHIAKNDTAQYVPYFVHF